MLLPFRTALRQLFQQKHEKGTPLQILIKRPKKTMPYNNQNYLLMLNLFAMVIKSENNL